MENVLVEEPGQALGGGLTKDPIKMASFVSGAILLLWLVAALFKRFVRPSKGKEPLVPVSIPRLFTCQRIGCFVLDVQGGGENHRKREEDGG